jgi:hypothetical protein
VKLYEIDELEDEEDGFVWVDLESQNSVPISSLTKKAWKFFQ